MLLYEEKRKKLNELNGDKEHFVNSNDICTPMECVEEMINAIPIEFWKRKGASILDPCCGNGNFPARVEEMFNLYSNNEYELNLNEINPKRIANVNKLFDNVIITEKDFFIFDKEKKYDLIIANPPYAKIDIEGVRAAKNHNLSREFVKKSLSILNKDGYLVYIIPDNWMSLSDRNDIVEMLSEYQFIHINIHKAKKYFPGVGSSFTWFVLKKEKNNRAFLIENSYGKEENSLVDLKVGQRSIPLFYNNIVKSILDKTLYSDKNKIKIETTSDLHKYTKKLLLSAKENDDFKYRIWHTQNQQIWSKRKHKFQDGWNVFISLTSYYSTFIDKDCGMTQSIAFVRCKDETESKKLKVILDHPLYVFINNIHRYGNFNNIRILQKFPYPDTGNIWDSFDITDNEKDFILDYLS